MTAENPADAVREALRILGEVAARVEHDMGGYYEITVEDWQAMVSIIAALTARVAASERDASLWRALMAIPDARIETGSWTWDADDPGMTHPSERLVRRGP